MKALKKVLVVALCAAMTLTAVPKTEAEAAGVLATYNFDTTDGMTDPGYGTPPSIVSDPERGNVLQFADGETSSYKTETGNAKGEHKCEIILGSPSAYEIPNPYDSKGLTSMTFSYWVKVTDPEATKNAAGVLGWVSPECTDDHPDARAGANSQEEIGWWEKGSYIFGANVVFTDLVTEIPMLNFAGLYHNWYCYWNDGTDLADSTWHHIIVTTDSSDANTKVYLDGQDLAGYHDMGKRYNKGEKDATNKANTLEPTLMDVIGMAGTKLYLGHTGSNPTSSGVYIDDVTFYDAMITDAEAQSMYEAAKASSSSNQASGDGSTGNTDTTQNAGNTGTDSTSNNNVTGSNTTTKNNNTNKGNTQSNLPQTGVMSTTALVGIGVAVIGVGAVLLKKKED